MKIEDEFKRIVDKSGLTEIEDEIKEIVRRDIIPWDEPTTIKLLTILFQKYALEMVEIDQEKLRDALIECWQLEYKEGRNLKPVEQAKLFAEAKGIIKLKDSKPLKKLKPGEEDGRD